MNVETSSKITVFNIPILPPSSNQIYVNRRGGGGRFLSPVAEQYKATTKSYLGEHYMMEISNLNPNGIYAVTLNFLLKLEDVVNPTYGNGKKNAAKTQYKKIDASNRIKLLEDCLKDVTGIDDSSFFSITAKKRISSKPMVIIELREIQLDDVFYQKPDGLKND
jgi:Holliday junction resolvase RusA-like endonuclease